MHKAPNLSWFKSTLNTSSFLDCTARCRAVLPKQSWASALAPYSNNRPATCAMLSLGQEVFPPDGISDKAREGE